MSRQAGILVASFLFWMSCETTYGQERSANPLEKSNHSGSDAYGDPLPPGAIARLGTMRLRNCWSGIAFSHDGKFLASSDFEKRVWIWETSTGKPVHCYLPYDLNPFSTRISQLLFSPDGRTLYAAFEAGVICSWDLIGRESKPSIQLGDSVIASLAIAHNGRRMAIGLFDQTVVVRDLDKAQNVLHLSDLQSTGGFHGFQVGFGSEGKTIVALGTQVDGLKHAQCACLWETDTGRKLRRLTIDYDPYRVYLPPSGQHIYSVDSKGILHLWDAASGIRRPICEGLYGVDSIAFSPNCQLVAIQDLKGIVRLIDLSSRKVLSQWQNSIEEKCKALSSNQRVLAMSNSSNFIVLRDSGGKELLSVRGHTSQVTALSYLGDGKCLASYSGDETFRLWDLDSMRPLGQVNLGRVYREQLRFSGDGASMVVANGDSLALWDVHLLRKRIEWKAHSASIGAVAISLDGKTVASGAGDGSIAVWEVATGKAIRIFAASENAGAIKKLVFCSKEKLAAITASEAKVTFWNVARGKKIGETGEIEEFDSTYSCLGFFPWREQLAMSVLAGRGAQVWDPLRQEWSDRWVDERWNGGRLVSTRDGRLVALGGWPVHERSIYVLEAITGDVIRSIKGQSTMCAGFAPDGRSLATAGAGDCSILVWDLTGLGKQGVRVKVRAEELHSRISTFNSSSK